MKFKLIALIAFLFIALAFTQDASSQYLTCSTYVANTEDSIAVSGSTDAGSDWFSMNGNKEVWLEVSNGTFWYTYKIDYPVEQLKYLKVEMEGSDTTLTVQGYTGGQNIVLPLCSINSTSVYINILDIGATTRYRIKFRSFQNRSGTGGGERSYVNPK